MPRPKPLQVNTSSGENEASHPPVLPAYLFAPVTTAITLLSSGATVLRASECRVETMALGMLS